jgi:phosphate-selective porin OprO/OprP
VATFTDRAIGARYENSGANWFVAAGIFGDAMSNSDTTGDEGWGASGRLVYSPIIEDERVLHLGVRGSYREVDIATPTMQIKDKTTDFSGLSIVNTGALNDAESATLFGPEMAAVWGPLYVFAEHTTTQVGRTAAPDLEFSGWHAAAAWSLTGESRASRYSMNSGEFKGLRPAKNFDWANGGIGAWEIAARYAAIDLNDGNVMGGTEDALSIALNWYPNRSVRIMADWSRVLDTDESNTIRMFAQDMDIFTLRTQWNF